MKPYLHQKSSFIFSSICSVYPNITPKIIVEIFLLYVFSIFVLIFKNIELDNFLREGGFPRTVRFDTVEEKQTYAKAVMEEINTDNLLPSML